jgi:NADPH:quinone reductase-like Zn-dependent oxidoreductase
MCIRVWMKRDAKSMKAIVTSRYGGAEVLELQEVERPAIGEDEILVQIRACSVNPIDWKVRKGAYKVLTGPKPPRILGGDYAGVVVAVGSRITGYEPGDAVWGFIDSFKRGTYAEYVNVRGEEIDLKPKCLSFKEAASMPTVGLTAYQALVYKGRIEKEERVLINGSSGGVGLSAVQIARAFDAHVTGVCSTKNLSTVRNMGANDVIDYTQQDLLDGNSAYDIIFDVVSNQSFSRVKSKLTRGGVYVRTLPSFRSLLLGPLTNMFSAKQVKSFDCKASREDLITLRQMVDEGTLSPVIENVYPLERVRDAHARSETGHVVGKLVLEII